MVVYFAWPKEVFLRFGMIENIADEQSTGLQGKHLKQNSHP